MPLKQSYSVSNLSELTDYNGSHCDIIFVNDIVRTGGHPLRWVGNTLKANGGTHHQGLGGVWELMFDGAVNVNWFGAVANGTDVTENFQKAVDYAFEVAKPVYVPGNTSDHVYALNQINLYDNTILFGDYRRSIIIPASSRTTTIFNVEGIGFRKETKTFNNIYRLTILNQLHGGPITTNCSAIRANYCNDFYLSELVVDGFDVNVNIENSWSVYMNKVRCRGASRNNIRVTWQSESAPFVGTWTFMNECEFNGGNFAHAPSKEKYSVFIENMASVTIDKTVIAGNLGGGIKFIQSYLSLSAVGDMTYIVITACDIDSNHGTGISGEYARNCVINRNWIASGRENKVSGIHLLNCESSSITSNQCFLNGHHGILLETCRFLTVSNNICINNGLGSTSTHTGINVIDSTNNTFSNNICNSIQYGWKDGRQSKGIEEQGTSNFNIFSSNILQPSIKPLTIVGKNTSRTNNIL